MRDDEKSPTQPMWVGLDSTEPNGPLRTSNVQSAKVPNGALMELEHQNAPQTHFPSLLLLPQLKQNKQKNNILLSHRARDELVAAV